MEVATTGSGSFLAQHNGRLLQQFGLECMAVFDSVKNGVPNEKVPGKLL